MEDFHEASRRSNLEYKLKLAIQECLESGQTQDEIQAFVAEVIEEWQEVYI